MKQEKLNNAATYDLMYELRRGLKLHSWTYRDKAGALKAEIILNYITADQKVHQVARTEIEL